MGWLNIYASVYQEEADMSIFDLSLNSGKQLIWIGGTILIFVAIIFIDFKFYESVSFLIYGVIIFLLITVLVFGTKVSGARSWFELASFIRIQPSEFAKFATALAVARYMNIPGFRFSKLPNMLIVVSLVLIPILLILLQPDPGTALIFFSFIIVFYREGLTPIVLLIGFIFIVLFIFTLFFSQVYIVIGIVVIVTIVIIFTEKTFFKIGGIVAIAILTIGFTFSLDYFQSNILKPHHQKRLKVLIHPASNPLREGRPVTQR